MSGRHSPGYVAPELPVELEEPHPEAYAPDLAALGFVQPETVVAAPVELGFGESGFVELGLEPAPVVIAPVVAAPVEPAPVVAAPAVAAPVVAAPAEPTPALPTLVEPVAAVHTPAAVDDASSGWSLAALGFAEPVSRSNYERPTEPAFVGTAFPSDQVPEPEHVPIEPQTPLRLVM